ncbi:MAG: hypothetical protein U0164_18940 [Gemmatimonadaceae bacterium]
MWSSPGIPPSYSCTDVHGIWSIPTHQNEIPNLRYSSSSCGSTLQVSRSHAS